MDYQYSHAGGEDTARAAGLAMPISSKQAVEICSMIRGKKLQSATQMLGRVIALKTAVPYRRHNSGGTGHRTGIGPGRYPAKACTEILRILENAKANAQTKGLDAASLVIEHISAKRAGKAYHYGRKRRRLMKRTHLEVIVKEEKAAKTKTKGQQQ